MKLGKTLIIGDSYSTFDGYIPDGYFTWYSSQNIEDNDVTKVEQTWWYNLFDGKENILLQNDSFSGTTVCNTVREGYSVNSSFVSRFDTLVRDGFFEENEVDTILIFGYTNDCWTDVPFGEEKYNDITEEDLLNFYPAVCYLAAKIKETVPNAAVYWMLNTDLDKKFPNAIKTAAEHYGQKYIEFEAIDKLAGHPSVKGMKQIAETVKNL